MSKLKLVIQACYKRRYIRSVAKNFINNLIDCTLRIYTTRLQLYSPITWDDTNSLKCEESSERDIESNSDSDYIIFNMGDL